MESNEMSNQKTASEEVELVSLRKLSCSLEKLGRVDTEYEYRDAEIEVEGTIVGIHRCILAARSLFFHNLFNLKLKNSNGDRPIRYLLSDLIPQATVGYEAFKVVLNYLYSAKVNSSPPQVSTCVDESCCHASCAPPINFAVQMMYASSTFQITELVALLQRRLLRYADEASVEDVIPILTVAYHCHLEELLSHCVERIARSDLDSTTIEKELPDEAAGEIRAIRLRLQPKHQQEEEESVSKNVRRIYRALDSDDIELVRRLLRESALTLDHAFALHYAAAYSIPNIFDEVRKLGDSDINMKNWRGHTVLHVAARRKDPAVLLRLLDLGASVFDTTRDGRTALTIRRRLTRPKDYNEATKHGYESNKDRLCIDVLEREMSREPSSGKISEYSTMAAADLHMTLLLLENRVAMARSFFPLEARLAMQIAYANSTSVFAGLSTLKGSFVNFREVDLNQLSSEQVNKLHQRAQALQKTVETGRRFFPNCSEFLDRLSADDTSGNQLLDKGTPEERIKKRTRYMEIMASLKEAFDKDVAEQNWIGFSSSSSNGSLVHKVKKR